LHHTLKFVTIDTKPEIESDVYFLLRRVYSNSNNYNVRPYMEFYISISFGHAKV